MEGDVNRTIEEQLSAFLDGELRKEELELLVRRLERDNQYRATLARYSLIGNVVRKDPVQTFPKRFRAGVMDAIAVDSPPPPVATEKQLPFVAQWKKPFVSAAAVLLLFAGISSLGLLDNGTGSVGQVSQLADDSSGMSENSYPAAPAAFSNEQPEGSVRVRQATLDRQRLTSYMVSHREYSKPLHGPIANSRIVVQQVRFEE